MYNLCVGAIVKNEAPFLPEFLEFHLLQGVEHFFILEHGSTDNTLQVLHDYEKQGILTYESHPRFTIGNQMGCFNHILDKYGKLTEWLALIDTDEFLYARDIKLPAFLNPLECSGVAVHWLMFGSNGELLKTPGLVIERFTRREAKVNAHVKTIVRPSCAVRMGKNPHVVRTTGSVLDENGSVLEFEYALSYPATADKIAIAHFHTKSHEEYMERKKGRESTERLEHVFQVHDKNEVEDTYLLQFVPQIKSNIEQRSYA